MFHPSIFWFQNAFLRCPTPRLRCFLSPIGLHLGFFLSWPSLYLPSSFSSVFLVLSFVSKKCYILQMCKREANWIGHILCRNCLLQWVAEGKIQGGLEMTGRQGRRCRRLLDDCKERRGYSHLKEEALDRTMWRAGFWRGFGPVVRQTTKWMNCNCAEGSYDILQGTCLKWP